MLHTIEMSYIQPTNERSLVKAANWRGIGKAMSAFRASPEIYQAGARRNNMMRLFIDPCSKMEYASE